MVQYFLYKSNNTITPYVIVDENTIDDTHTSVFLVGKRKESYGQAEQQSKLWMLENFANATQPANAIQGQTWHNTSDDKLYVCVDDVNQVFEKVNKPIVAGSVPTTNVSVGDLWFNTTDKKLYVFGGASPSDWIVTGPQIDIPTSVEEQKYYTAVTGDGTPTEMFINGVVNSRSVIPTDESWNFEIRLIARRVNNTSEVFSVNLRGTLNRDNSGSAVLIGGVEKSILAKSVSLANTVDVAVSADVVNNSLRILVTGEAAKVIEWNAGVRITKVNTN